MFLYFSFSLKMERITYVVIFASVLTLSGTTSAQNPSANIPNTDQTAIAGGIFASAAIPPYGGLSVNKDFNLGLPFGGGFGAGVAPFPAGIAVPSPPIGIAATYGGPIGTGYISQTPLGAFGV